MTRFLVDAQLPPALARSLAARGFPADHVADLGLATASDLVIWTAAIGLGAAIITKDRDFATFRTSVREGPPVIWVRLANTRRAVLLACFDRVLPDVVAALARGEVLVEIA